MLQPVTLQLAHFNVEHSAQISKDAIAVAQQTGQGQEMVQKSVENAQKIQPSLATAEAVKVKRKGDEEHRRQRGGGRFLSGKPRKILEEGDGAEDAAKNVAVRSFDLYA